MKCALVVDGTRGDAQPAIVLGQRLKTELGYDVQVITNRNHGAFIEASGLSCAAVAADIRAKMKDGAAMGAAFKGGAHSFARYLWGDSILPVWQALDAYKPDLVIYNMTTVFMACAWAEANQVPAIACYMQILVPITEHPPVWFAPHRPYTGPLESESDKLMAWDTFFEGWCDQKHCALMEEIVASSDSSVTEERTSTSMQWDNHFEFIKTFSSPTVPMLICIPKLVVGQLKSLTGNHHITGFLTVHADQQVDDTNSEFFSEGLDVITHFLDAGAPPVYIGWGSMTVSAEVVVPQFVKALKATGQRGIFCSGWGDLSAMPTNDEDNDDLQKYISENVLCIAGAPHEWLFPRCALSVHHGGCGTCAASLRAGRPTIVTPVMVDQKQWAIWINQLGVGAGLGHPMQINSEEIAAAISKCLEEDVRRRAADVAEQLRSEDGAGNAVEVIRDFMGSPCFSAS